MDDIPPTPETIVSEFSLIPGGRKELEDFFAARYEELCSRRNAAAKKDLQQLLTQVIPEERLAELKSIFAGTSEYAMHIRNLPERPGLEHIPRTHLPPKSSYSYFIGTALYEMNNIRRTDTTSLVRRPNKKVAPPGHMIHRDTFPGRYYDKVPGEHVIFSCAYNGEEALTDVINLRRAIAELDPTTQEKIKIRTLQRGSDNYNECTVSDLQTMLNAPLDSGHFLVRVELTGDPNAPQAQSFIKAVNHHSVSINLQPGELLIINENTMFHRAQRGDASKVIGNPLYSRVLYANAGRNS